MTIKMEDIARIANVSRSAVSLALNGKEGVSPETKERIFKVINEYNYKPLRKSRRSTNRKLINVTFLVIKSKGIVSNNFHSLPFFDNLISSLSENISSFGGTLQISTTDIGNLTDSLEPLKKKKGLSGTIILGTDLTEKDINIINTELNNTVFIDTYFENITADFITMDNFQGGLLAGNYIISKGYRKIGYLASDKAASNFLYRRTGFNMAIKNAGLDISNDFFYAIPPNPSVADLAKISLSKLPEAIFCEDDYIATRLIKLAQNNGIKVPEDLAVMGFDDVYEGALISPELTTIHVPIEQIASQALYQLQKKIFSADWHPQKNLVSTNLVIRESL